MQPREQFLQLINQHSFPNTIRGEGRIWQNGHVEFLFTFGSGTLLTLNDDGIYLEDFYAFPKEQKYGTCAMQSFTELADKSCTGIFLHACAQDKNPDSQERLYRFYSRFGFRQLEDNLMSRMPNLALRS